MQSSSSHRSNVVDLTMNDDQDSLSELSDAPEPSSSSPPTKSNSKSKAAASSSSLKKSASSSNVAAKFTNGNSKPKARKSESAPSASTSGSPSASNSSKPLSKLKPDGTPVKSTRSFPISDAARARTHVNCEGNPIKLCHQHHQPCKGALLECTFMRAPGKRCHARYCFSSLKRFYDMDPETIVKSNRMMVNPEEHCPATEAKYAWKCPKCRGRCACSTCRKAMGLEPLGKWIGGSRKKKADTEADLNEKVDAKPKKAKAKAKCEGASEDAETRKAGGKAATKGKTKERSIAEAVQKQSGKARAKASASASVIDIDADEDDGISTPPPAGASTKPAPGKKTLASILSSASVRAPIFKPIKPPTPHPPPVFEVIPTKLPDENLRARMWIYESMVRFDKFGLSRSVLSQLDKLDHWTHSMLQDMLSCLLKTIAGLSNIEKGQPTKPFANVITAFRSHGKALDRGEPWNAATELLADFGLNKTKLEYVEEDVPVQVEMQANKRSESPPAEMRTARLTRARKAKQNNQYEIARQLSLLDSWEEDEFGSEADVTDGDEDAQPSKRGRRGRAGEKKKSIYVYDDSSDDDDDDDDDASMADPDDCSRGGRGSGRSRKAVQKEPEPEVRLTGRQQAIKLQQEEEAKQRQKEEQEAAQANAAAEEESRKRGASTTSKGNASDDNDEEEAYHKTYRTNGRGEQKRRRLTAGSSADEAESGVKAQKHVADDTKTNGITEEKDEANSVDDQRERASPDLETKIATIATLLDAVVMAEPIAEELKTAAENIVSLERQHRIANFEMEKEIAEELADLHKRAPSIVSREYQNWKAEKQQLEHDVAWRRQDARVISELAIDTHALRTGPMGWDADGREYWHLREYQEKMPKFTEGRYAWCLVVLGKPFPANPYQPKQDSKTADGDMSMAQVGAEAEAEAKSNNEAAPVKDEADDSGLTSLDASSDNDKVEFSEDVKLGLPTSRSNGGSDSNTDGNKYDDETRICMGANDPRTIKTLIDFVEYRLEKVEYEENVAMQQREIEAHSARGGDGNSGGSSPGWTGESTGVGSAGGESMHAIRKAKQTLKHTQEARSKQVNQLIKRLNKTKEYFAWHREEVASE
ncbi:uncharacterized protein MEPE_03509 [Melanopsichium pennsylvanicum]|uniref:Zinc-finger domain-containing protein n=2 Tax=Melanopsichium pennsylvanicum TaxID=63383 RepID=A0AAJ4XLJ8_9BASI|nr:putative protein [Melanopsichium pennsylvanicum 4]SNX84800.1 uncharacterized protein MEPE_03509 [Melanopsichium pennsylvanicum]